MRGCVDISDTELKLGGSSMDEQDKVKLREGNSKLDAERCNESKHKIASARCMCGIRVQPIDRLLSDATAAALAETRAQGERVKGLTEMLRDLLNNYECGCISSLCPRCALAVDEARALLSPLPDQPAGMGLVGESNIPWESVEGTPKPAVPPTIRAVNDPLHRTMCTAGAMSQQAQNVPMWAEPAEPAETAVAPKKCPTCGETGPRDPVVRARTCPDIWHFPAAQSQPADELSKGTFSCPVCGRGTPHSAEDHKVSGLPFTVYGVPSYDKTFLVWVGSDKQKAEWMADFSRNVIEYRMVDPAEPEKP
jgi:hypothetical protein